MNPELLNIEQKKLVNLWPVESTLAKFILPYLKRSKNENLVCLDYASLRGETAYELLDGYNKISKVYCVQDFNQEQRPNATMYNDIIQHNLSNFKNRYELAGDVPNTEYDLVCLNLEHNLNEALEKTYHLVKSRGIIAGADFANSKVKEEVNKFRRNNKIGININVYNTYWFWYKS